MLRSTIVLFAFASVAYGASHVPLERTAIFPKEQAGSLLAICLIQPENITGHWTPAEEDLVGVEDQLEPYLSSTWTSLRSERKEMPKWRHYYRQVCGIVQDGERRLLISYGEFSMIEDPRYIADRKEELARRGRKYDSIWWKSEVLAVQDGGSMFFRVIFDPKAKRFVWYDQNIH